MDSVVIYWDSSQGFPQVLRTWREGGAALQNLMRGGASFLSGG